MGRLVAFDVRFDVFLNLSLNLRSCNNGCLMECSTQ